MVPGCYWFRVGVLRFQFFSLLSYDLGTKRYGICHFWNLQQENIYEYMDIWIYEYMGIGMYEFMDIWIYGYMDIRIYGYMDIWIFGYMDILIYGYMDI